MSFRDVARGRRQVVAAQVVEMHVFAARGRNLHGADGRSVLEDASIRRKGAPRELVPELDGSGHFDLLVDMGDGAGIRHRPLIAGERALPARTREAFLWWAGDVGRQMLRTVDAVREGAWAGAEG